MPVSNPLLVIPTYNEVDNIQILLPLLLKAVPDAHVLVVDDGSPDGTAREVRRWADEDARVHLMCRDGKSGLGSAYRAGFEWGLREGHDALVEMDADLSHPPERLPALLEALDTSDVSIGSRYVSGGATANWPLLRRLISRGGNAYVSVVLGLGVKDATAGFRAFTRDAASRLEFCSLRSEGYCFQVENTYRAVRAGLRVTEVPITFIERVHGASKMSGRIIVEALWRTTTWGARDLFRRSTPGRAGAGVARRLVAASVVGVLMTGGFLGAAWALDDHQERPRAQAESGR